MRAGGKGAVRMSGRLAGAGWVAGWRGRAACGRRE